MPPIIQKLSSPPTQGGATGRVVDTYALPDRGAAPARPEATNSFMQLGEALSSIEPEINKYLYQQADNWNQEELARAEADYLRARKPLDEAVKLGLIKPEESPTYRKGYQIAATRNSFKEFQTRVMAELLRNPEVDDYDSEGNPTKVSLLDTDDPSKVQKWYGERYNEWLQSNKEAADDPLIFRDAVQPYVKAAESQLLAVHQEKRNEWYSAKMGETMSSEAANTLEDLMNDPRWGTDQEYDVHAAATLSSLLQDYQGKGLNPAKANTALIEAVKAVAMKHGVDSVGTLRSILKGVKTGSGYLGDTAGTRIAMEELYDHLDSEERVKQERMERDKKKQGDQLLADTMRDLVAGKDVDMRSKAAQLAALGRPDDISQLVSFERTLRSGRAEDSPTDIEAVYDWKMKTLRGEEGGGISGLMSLSRMGKVNRKVQMDLLNFTVAADNSRDTVESGTIHSMAGRMEKALADANGGLSVTDLHNASGAFTLRATEAVEDARRAAEKDGRILSTREREEIIEEEYTKVFNSPIYNPDGPQAKTPSQASADEQADRASQPTTEKLLAPKDADALKVFQQVSSPDPAVRSAALRQADAVASRYGMSPEDFLKAQAPLYGLKVVEEATMKPGWQNKYADQDWQRRLTKLSPEDEMRFQAWAKDNHVPLTDDYDMRGFWKNGGATAVYQNDGKLHYPDKYKTPLHKTFSGESIYARHDIPTPQWNKKDQLVAPNGTVIYDGRAANAKPSGNPEGESTGSKLSSWWDAMPGYVKYPVLALAALSAPKAGKVILSGLEHTKAIARARIAAKDVMKTAAEHADVLHDLIPPEQLKLLEEMPSYLRKPMTGGEQKTLQEAFTKLRSSSEKASLTDVELGTMEKFLVMRQDFDAHAEAVIHMADILGDKRMLPSGRAIMPAGELPAGASVSGALPSGERAALPAGTSQPPKALPQGVDFNLVPGGARRDLPAAQAHTGGAGFVVGPEGEAAQAEMQVRDALFKLTEWAKKRDSLDRSLDAFKHDDPDSFTVIDQYIRQTKRSK